jgi:hypothetical protein
MGPFGHHLNYDLSGYPRLHFTDTLTLFVKILRIADTYDALTADRAYRPRSFSPDEALRMMWERVGVEYDPILLKTFINMMGLYPVGTVLKLDSGELGLVVDYPNESERTRPQVLLLVDDGQGGLKGSEKLNLADRDQKTGSYERQIIKCLHPSVLVRIADFCSFNLQQSEISILKSKITTTFRCWSVRRGKLVLGGKVCIRVWCQSPGRHCSAMESTLDRNDNQGTGVSWALDRGRGHKRVLGVGVSA